jgi:hypothetical protein
MTNSSGVQAATRKPAGKPEEAGNGSTRRPGESMNEQYHNELDDWAARKRMAYGSRLKIFGRV